MLSDEEKKAIEHLTKKMKYHKDNPLDTYVWLTLDEHYVRIILKLVENLQKDIESWKKYCDEQENDITLKNNKICDLEFQVEKQSKEIEELSDKLTEKICKGVEEEILEEYRQTIINKDKEIEELKDTRSIFNMGRRSYKNEIEDKIKAKIEYYEKIDNPVGKRVLESLLEKE